MPIYQLPSEQTFWAIVPAAGIGARMQGDVAKQYLPLLDETVLTTTLNKLLQLQGLAGIVLALHRDDSLWPTMALAAHPKIHTVIGGDSRSASVLSALNRCRELAPGDATWALVHDAARPCVSLAKVVELAECALAAAPPGGGAILAVPCADTVKRVADATVECTEDRAPLWLAHTPQLFPLAALHAALSDCAARQIPVTDEASAIEAVGGAVRVVQDRRDNIKVTLPEDLAWAETILRKQRA